MKLREWKVYKSASPLGDRDIEDFQNLEIVAYYNLEKS